jgi:hypothetical protein
MTLQPRMPSFIMTVIQVSITTRILDTKNKDSHMVVTPTEEGN